MDPSSRSDSSSVATGQSPHGWSFVGHHTNRSSENPLYNSVGSIGNVVSPPPVVYEELPANTSTPANRPRPRDYLEPTQVSSVRTERVVTSNVLYASVEASSTLPPRSDLNQVYQFAPIEHAYDDKQITRCSCGWAEAVILSMAVLVILLSVASLIMTVIILAGVVPINRPAPSQPTMTTTDTVVLPPSIQEQVDRLMALRNDIDEFNSRVNRITNQTVQGRSAFQSRLDGFQSQLVVFSQSIQSDISPPILLDRANTSINTEQTCVMDETVACNLQQFACSGAQDPVVNSNSEFLTEFSCYLRSNGPINGSAALVTAVTIPTNRSGAFTLPEVQNLEFLQSCFCFLFSLHSETVECVRRFLRCSTSVPNLPLNVVV